jgi:hypothetical protein
MKKAYGKVLLLALAFLLTSSNFFSVASSATSTDAFEMPDVLVTQEVFVDGIAITYTTTSRRANALYSQEIVDLAGVLLLITVYDFEWYSLEVGTLIEDAGEGVFRTIPGSRQQEIACPYFIAALASFYAQHFSVDDATAEQHVRGESFLRIDEALEYTDGGEISPHNWWNFPSSGHYGVWRYAPIAGTFYFLDMQTAFNWEMALNTNFLNPAWTWDRVWFRNVDTRAFLWPFRYANAQRITLEVSVIPHGQQPVSFSLTVPPGLDVSVSNEVRTVIATESVEHTEARPLLYARIRMLSDISIYRQAMLSTFNIASIETRASLARWTPAGGLLFEHHLVRTGATISSGLSGPVISYIPR